MSTARSHDESFAGYKVNNAYRLDKNSKLNGPKSAFVEVNELCVRMKEFLFISRDLTAVNSCLGSEWRQSGNEMMGRSKFRSK